MSETSLSIRDKVEICALAWLASLKPTDAIWTPVEFKRRKEQTDRKFPRIVFDATRSPEDEKVEGLYRVELSMYLGTMADEVVTGSTPQVAHTQRSGFLAETFGYGNKEAFIAYCTANIPGIAVYDLFIEEEVSEQTERHWFDHLTYSVVCALRDE